VVNGYPTHKTFMPYKPYKQGELQPLIYFGVLGGIALAFLRSVVCLSVVCLSVTFEAPAYTVRRIWMPCDTCGVQ